MSKTPSDVALLRCLEGLDMGVVVLDGNAAVVHWNTWMSRHSGVPRRVALGARLGSLFPGIAKGRLAGAVEDAIAIGLSAFISHSVNAHLFPLLRNDGFADEPVAQSIIVRPLQIDGATGCLIQVFDESAAVDRERKLREQRNARHHAIIEAAQDSFITIDGAGLIQWVNPAAERKFGRGRDDLLGGHISLVLPEAKDTTAFVGGLTEMKAVDGNGSSFDAEVSTSRWVSNGVRWHTLFIRDVSERNQAAAELRQSQRMQSLGQLTGGIAHEFNNLLMVIRANTDLLSAKLEDAALREFAAEIAQAIDRGAALTSDLLSFSRKQPLRPQVLSLSEAVTRTLRLAAPTLGAQIACTITPEGSGLHVHADPTQLQNAVLNLLLNARDAMPVGGTITISLALEESTGLCHLRVADSGHGMAPDILELACEPFFTTKRVGHGTGLGLSMVVGFARQSGGCFRLESEPGHGTAATICLPKVEATVAGLSMAPADLLATPLPCLRILLVEDDPQLRNAVKTMLLGAGHEVTVAEDAFAALDHLARRGFDLLLSDIVLPRGMSGIILAREVRQTFPRLCIVLMSGYNELDKPMMEIVAEVADVLHKPFSQEELKRAMFMALSRF